MNKHLEMVKEFHKKFGAIVNDKPTTDMPENINIPALRFNLLLEEVNEFLFAAKDKNIIEIADALGDIAYVLYGTALTYGLAEHWDKIIEEIHRSNMSKGGPEGTVTKRPDGKILKGPNYFKPNLKKILEEPLHQVPIPASAYDKDFWTGRKHNWWKFGADEDGKRKSEGEHPKRILETFGQESIILDCAAGMGWLVKFLRELNAHAIGIDYSKYAVEHSPVKQFMIEGDVTKLPFQNNDFDLLISRECFEHLTLEQSEKAFKEMIRVSKKWLYLTIWMNFDKNADGAVVLDDFKNDPTHITYATRNFWNKRFQYYIDNGIIKEDKEKEEKLDWLQKGRCFVFEKLKDL